MTISRNLLYTLLGMAIVVVAVLLWSLDKGLGMLDEAFYLLHLKEGVTYFALSSWPEFFKEFPIKELVWFRFSILLLMVASSLALGISFCRYWKIELPGWVIVSFVIVAQFVWASPVQYVPNNATLNQILIYSSLASFFWGVNTDSILKRRVWLFISGAFIGFIPLVMITNTPIIGVIILLLVILFPNRKSVSLVLLYLLGILTSWLIFFAFFQRPEDFLASISEARYYLKFVESHGLRNIVKWNYNAVIHFIGMPLVLVLLLLAFHYELPKSRISRLLLALVGLAVLSFLLIGDVFSPISIFTTSLIYVLAVAGVVVYCDRQGDFRNAAVLIFFLLVPYFAALGTDVAFEVRSSGYALPLALVILVSSKDISKLYNYAFRGLFALAFVLFLSYPFRMGWIGYRLIDQTTIVKLPDRAGELKLSKSVAQTSEVLAPYLQGKRNVVVSDPKLLGNLYLADASPLYLYFRLNDSFLFEFVDSQPRKWDEIIFLEVENKPFSIGVQQQISELVKSGSHLAISLEGQNLYLPKR